MGQSLELANEPSAESQELITGESNVEPAGKTGEEDYDRASDNPAVNHCIGAWNRAYHDALAELDEDEDEEENEDEDEDENEDEDRDEDEDRVIAEKAAKSAFLRAIPALAGLNNIRDFIACVTYGEILDILPHYQAENLLESAKVALAAARQESMRRQSQPKRLGRPPKSPVAENK